MTTQQTTIPPVPIEGMNAKFKGWLYQLLGYLTKIKSGNGAPEGSVVGNIGDIYLNTAGGSATTLYVKESSPTPSTGWIGK